jgi:transcriptional regulator with XRE-family HTH domain
MKEENAVPVAANIDARIANRVRALRTELHMTLEVLAARSGVSRSMISLVERGESSATAVVLEKIATGLNVSLATLFEESSGPVNPVSRRGDRTPWRDPSLAMYGAISPLPTFPRRCRLSKSICRPARRWLLRAALAR